MREFESLDARPYDLMAIVSKTGEECGDDLGDPVLNGILAAIRRYPGQPITLRCTVASDYAYQNPETPTAKSLFDARCDLKILQRLGLVPGDTRPARDLFERLLSSIETAEGILWFKEATSEAWQGLPREECHYEAGRALGIGAIIPGRTKEDMAQVKVSSVKEMRQASLLEIRPHHLMCMTCFFGSSWESGPIKEDNLHEAIDIIHGNPEIPIRLVCGPCTICPPCHYLHEPSGYCIGGHGMALRDELKDLEVLQRLGLNYGDTLPARELYTRLFEKVTSALHVCGHGDGVERSTEWSVCGGADVNTRYAKGRAAGLGFLTVPEGKTQ
jgi:hypothetical protein